MATHTDNASIQTIILAAGKSSRFKTGRTKLVEKICGKEMIFYPTAVFKNLKIPILMVVGFQKDAVKDTVQKSFGNDITFIHQQEQKGVK